MFRLHLVFSVKLTSLSLESYFFLGPDVYNLKAYVVKAELLISESHVSIRYHVVHVPASMGLVHLHVI